MEISYLGHASFKLKGKQGIVVTDPFEKMTGYSFPSVTADVITMSHQHPDHNAASQVKPTANREKPFLISTAGEFEVSGISVFGYPTYHDDKKGEERGKNIVFSIHLDGVHILHLGDLGHTLTNDLIESFGEVDVLLCPVGGVYTIDSKTAVEVISSIEPSFIIPMHYKVPESDEKVFGGLQTVADFEKELGMQSEPVKSFSLTAGTQSEQTTLVVLSR